MRNYQDPFNERYDNFGGFPVKRSRAEVEELLRKKAQEGTIIETSPGGMTNPQANLEAQPDGGFILKLQ
jgi:hypothetical protein